MQSSWRKPWRRTLGVAALGAAVLAPGPSLRAQPTSERFTKTLDAALGFGSTARTGALSWNLLYGIGSSRRAKLGLGVRFASFAGKDAVAYTTADAALIRDGRINTLRVSDARTNSLNVAFQVKYQLTDRLEAGFDIDLIGAGFGSARTGSYASTRAALAGPQPADASSFNNLRGGKPDRGQLDSEFFLGYWLSERWGVRVGFSHFLSEYTTVAALDFGNRRYRHSANLGFVALSFRP